MGSLDSHNYARKRSETIRLLFDQYHGQIAVKSSAVAKYNLPCVDHS